MMNRWRLCFIFYFCFFLFTAKAQTTQPDPSAGGNISFSFRPSIAVVVGVLSVMFSLTFLLLMYAKFCQNNSVNTLNSNEPQLPQNRSRFSGIDKTVIESLPFFRFSSLKGSRKGLECAVCLSKFEDAEILRLLPKCRHAFHINCVDRWLEIHSSCPLCRHKVEAEDSTIFIRSNSLRLSRNMSELTDEANVELFVHREPEHHGSSSRFSIESSFRKIEKANNDLLLATEGEDREFVHKFKHRIIVSDVVHKHRWSDVNSSDLMFLNSEMLSVLSSKRFAGVDSNSERFTASASDAENGFVSNVQIMKIREELEKKRLLESMASKISKSKSVSSAVLPPSTSGSDANGSNNSRVLIPSGSGKRSMSEITNYTRFADFGWKNRAKDASAMGAGKEERLRKLWLPIARRTVQWLAGRERSQFQYTRQFSSAV